MLAITIVLEGDAEPSGLSKRTSKTVTAMQILTGLMMPVISAPRSVRMEMSFDARLFGLMVMLQLLQMLQLVCYHWDNMCRRAPTEWGSISHTYFFSMLISETQGGLQQCEPGFSQHSNIRKCPLANVSCPGSNVMLLLRVVTCSAISSNASKKCQEGMVIG